MHVLHSHRFHPAKLTMNSFQKPSVRVRRPVLGNAVVKRYQLLASLEAVLTGQFEVNMRLKYRLFML